ncbi:MAG: SpoIIE family protein phosphatase [Streptosporangiaceae bacterium]
MSEELVRIDLRDSEGIFVVRRAGREIAAALQLDAQDQVRVATALSEVGRTLFTQTGPVTVRFFHEAGVRPALTVEMAYSPRSGPVPGIRTAARLMDLTEDQGLVRMRKALPAGAPPMNEAALVALRGHITTVLPVSALEELRLQNADLIAALDELRLLNTELAETNQGVLMLYNQLSGELEETNRGVVALYAGLEEKTDQLRIAAEAMAALARTTLAINSVGTFDELAQVAAAGTAEIFNSPAAVFVLPTDGPLRRVVVRSPGEDFRFQDVPAAVLDRLAGFAALGDDMGTALAVVPRDRWLTVLPDADVKDGVLIALSRTKSGRPPICVAVETDGVPGESDRDLLRQLGQTVALAMEALRSYAEEHTIALTLQRSLLPSSLPEIPGWSVAVRYQPASDTAEIGGDFYEVLDLGGPLLVAIGDIQGHSLAAATVMAEVRHALRAFADEGHDAEAILARLNSIILRFHPRQTATLCLMTLDPLSGSLRIISGGHPPALLIDADGARYGKGGGLLIGFPFDAAGIEETVIEPGGTVVLYTDGLIEDRGVPLDDNFERLRALAAPAEPDLEAFTDRILAEFGLREDDVALLILRRDPAPG